MNKIRIDLLSDSPKLLAVSKQELGQAFAVVKVGVIIRLDQTANLQRTPGLLLLIQTSYRSDCIDVLQRDSFSIMHNTVGKRVQKVNAVGNRDKTGIGKAERVEVFQALCNAVGSVEQKLLKLCVHRNVQRIIDLHGVSVCRAGKDSDALCERNGFLASVKTHPRRDRVPHEVAVDIGLRTDRVRVRVDLNWHRCRLGIGIALSENVRGAQNSSLLFRKAVIVVRHQHSCRNCHRRACRALPTRLRAAVRRALCAVRDCCLTEIDTVGKRVAADPR